MVYRWYPRALDHRYITLACIRLHRDKSARTACPAGRLDLARIRPAFLPYHEVS